MCDDRIEFMDRGPGDSPGNWVINQGIQALPSGIVPFGVLAMRIDEQVGIDRYQAPRPS